MATVPLAKAIISSLESRITSFFWCSSDGCVKYHWAAWQKITFPTCEGGLGVCSIPALQDAVTCKLWFIFRQHKSLWSSFMMDCYRPTDFSLLPYASPTRLFGKLLFEYHPLLILIFKRLIMPWSGSQMLRATSLLQCLWAGSTSFLQFAFLQGHLGCRRTATYFNFCMESALEFVAFSGSAGSVWGPGSLGVPFLLEECCYIGSLLSFLVLFQPPFGPCFLVFLGSRFLHLQ